MHHYTYAYINSHRYIYLHRNIHTLGFPGVSDSKESACNVGDSGSIPELLRRLPGEENGNPASILFFFFSPVFLPRDFHGQRSLVGYSPWDHKESDMTERFSLSFTHV